MYLNLHLFHYQLHMCVCEIHNIFCFLVKSFSSIFSSVVKQKRVLHNSIINLLWNFQWYWQILRAGKLWKLIWYYISGLEVFYTVILRTDLIQNKNEYRDKLNLITFTLEVGNPFSLQHTVFSLQVERWMCQKCVLYRAAMLCFKAKNYISGFIKTSFA